jgi:hypothetical protein
MLLILGDFDYQHNPNAWDDMLTESLGSDFPVFAVVGNHDKRAWPRYRQKLLQRAASIEGASCEGDYGVNAHCTYQGLSFVLSGAGTMGSGHAGFIESRFAADASIWRICAWHKNQRAVQIGGKGDEVGWGPYEACRRAGAIIATAHEHSYQRTKSLSSIESQSVDPEWPDAARVRVGGGSTFVFVSGLGGTSIRDQERCLPTRPPYGCGGVWASIYTLDQRAAYGALFIEFHLGGDPYSARGYFKTTRGEIIDEFWITAEPGQ